MKLWGISKVDSPRLSCGSSGVTTATEFGKPDVDDVEPYDDAVSMLLLHVYAC